jgi:formate-dependent nitrite reductase membrane component NrfD
MTAAPTLSFAPLPPSLVMDGMSIYVISLLALLFALMSWVLLRVTRNARRQHQAIFDINPTAQWILCAVCLLCAIFWFSNVIHALQNGHVRIVSTSRYSSLSSSYTVYRANDPLGYWEAIAFETYGGFLMAYLPITEIFLAIHRKTHPRHRPRAPHESVKT